VELRRRCLIAGVEQILETLTPLALLIGLGSALAHTRFLGEPFIADLNKLAFWIALPALVFTSASKGSASSGHVWQIFGVMVVATLAIALIAWTASFALRMPAEKRGTLVQSAFRGNLAYIGVPVLANSFGPAAPAMSAGIIAMVLTMALYNILAVIVLQASQHTFSSANGRRMALSISTNPLLLAGVAGLIVPLINVRLPLFLDRTLLSLGAAAVPIALLCIGGSLVIVPMRGKHAWIVAAALLKVAALPVIVYFLGRLAGLDPTAQRIALVFSACPTAAASFVMARQMGGDEALASGSIALSTLLSVLPLSVVLWLTS
jgi:predicted permease